MPDWTRIVNTTMHEFIRQEEPQVIRNRKLSALMLERGRITMNHSGDIMDWKVRFKQAPMVGFTDGDTLNFAQRDKWRTAQLPWRGYASTDSMTKMQREKNKSSEAIIKLFSAMTETLMEDMDQQFGEEFYVDGELGGNSKRLHGLESLFGASAPGAGALIAAPNDTYAGLLTNLAGYGGSWTGTWPTGTGDAHYDFWSPLIVSYTNTGWTATTKTWPNTCVESLRFGIIKGKKNSLKSTKLELVLMADELYRQFLDAYGVKENLYVTRGMESPLYKLGFTDTLNFDGIDLTYEYGVPAGCAYGLPIEQMELCSLQGQLFVPTGPEYNIVDQSYRVSLDFMGNLRIKGARYMTKWAALG